MANHEHNCSGVSKGPFPATSIFFHGIIYRDWKGKCLENVLFVCLFWKQCFLTRELCLSFPWVGALELHDSIHSLNKMSCSMPSPAWRSVVHCTISLHTPGLFFVVSRPVAHVTVSALAHAWMWAFVSRNFLDSNRSMLHWDKLTKRYWFLRS